jgi:Sec7-like guanine-nucleotide exchange factor
MKGETQEQDRILQVRTQLFNKIFIRIFKSKAFAARYVDTNSSLGNSVDSVHRLVYAFVLLNTDLHSKNLESHMTANQFVTNTMSSDLNEKLDERFLVECYQSIRQNPILRPPQTCKFKQSDTFDIY